MQIAPLDGSSRPVGKAAILHLQALQAGRPLETSQPACPVAAEDFPSLQPEALFAAGREEDNASLRETVRIAEFWISLLEGEKQELQEEVAKHKTRYQLALRQADAKASALREAEGEKKRLQAELKWLQQSRDEAICDRHLRKQDVERTKVDVDSAASRADSLEAEMHREREEKEKLEAELVRTKVRYVETLSIKDGLEDVVQHYEEIILGYNPAFEPVHPTSFRSLKPQGPLADLELRSEASDGTNATENENPGASVEQAVTKESKKGSGWTKGFKKMFKGTGKRKTSDSHDDVAAAQQAAAQADAAPSVSAGSSPVAEATEPPTDEPDTGRNRRQTRRWENRTD